MRDVGGEDMAIQFNEFSEVRARWRKRHAAGV